MENKEFTPSESLALIANVISDAKTRFSDNGFSFIFLGLCTFVASLGQFLLLKYGFYQNNYIPYFIMPIAGLITFFYYKKKKRKVKSTNIIGSLLSVLGAILGFNLMVAGFLFWNKFGVALIPFMLVLFSIWPLIMGVVIRNKLFIACGIVANTIAYLTFFVSRENQPFMMAIVSLIAIVLPGIALNHSRKESHV